MQVQQLVVGELSTNCYLVISEDTKRAAVIDPGGDAPLILSAIHKAGVTVDYIIDTHGHLDHVLAAADVQAATKAKIAIHKLDVPLLTNDPTGLADWLGVKLPIFVPDLLLDEGDELRVGDITLRVIHTPGHTPGHITLLTAGAAFVGDVLFAQGIGRTDFPGGSYQQLMESIRTRLLTLDDDTIVYPGHGPATTIGAERRQNPWL